MPEKVKSFFERPLRLTLEPFRGFGFAGVSSWAQIELYAAVSGVAVDVDFLNAICAVSYFYENVYDALLSEIGAEESLVASVANDTRFVECVFKTYMPRLPGRRYPDMPQSEVAGWLNSECAGHVGTTTPLYARPSPYEEAGRRKYELLSAVDRKFPYLLVKFYAANAKDLRHDDMCFVTWLTKRLEGRAASDLRLRPVLSALRAEARSMDRTAMYTA